MIVPFRPDLLVGDIFRGTVGETPRPVSPHRLPLCTYCGCSHIDHPERPTATTRPCRSPKGCDCRDFRDPEARDRSVIGAEKPG